MTTQNTLAKMLADELHNVIAKTGNPNAYVDIITESGMHYVGRVLGFDADEIIGSETRSGILRCIELDIHKGGIHFATLTDGVIRLHDIAAFSVCGEE